MTDDRAEFAANRDAGLVKRHEQRLARLTDERVEAINRTEPPVCTCPTDADVTPDMRSETGQHLSGCPSTTAASPKWADLFGIDPDYGDTTDVADTKALIETATRLGRELGRREAAEEIAHRCELDATYDTASRYHFAKIAREIATKEPK